MRRSILLSVFSFMMLTSVCPARTWYVTPGGSGDVPTIQAGVDSVAPGDTVMLASGVFTGPGNHNVVVTTHGFVICSETGNPEDCVIDCEGHLGPGRRGFDFRGSFEPQTVVCGITICNANVTDQGGGVLNEGSLTMRDCVFESNSAGFGGGAIGLHEAGGFFVLKGCRFNSNEASGGYGGGALLIVGAAYLEVTIDSCAFYANQSDGYGGAMSFPYHEVEAYISNCAFVENSALSCGGGIAVQSIGYARVTECTFYANHAPRGSAIDTWTYEPGFSITDVHNCIIAYGTGGEGYYQDAWYPDDRSMQCTDIYGNEGGDYTGGLASRLGEDGNFSACPSFCNIQMEPYDLSLCSGSPCLPGNHPDGYDCGFVGALGEGCTCGPSRSRPTAWGSIKALFR